MFMLYNAVMRQFPQDVVKELEGNTFTTTIHCINSAIIKLSRACPLRPRFVVRGSKGMRLPQKFAIKDELGNQVACQILGHWWREVFFPSNEDKSSLLVFGPMTSVADS